MSGWCVFNRFWTTMEVCSTDPWANPGWRRDSHHLWGLGLVEIDYFNSPHGPNWTSQWSFWPFPLNIFQQTRLEHGAEPCSLPFSLLRIFQKAELVIFSHLAIFQSRATSFLFTQSLNLHTQHIFLCMSECTHIVHIHGFVSAFSIGIEHHFNLKLLDTGHLP